jgi:hypothetical protein
VVYQAGGRDETRKNPSSSPRLVRNYAPGGTAWLLR